MASVKKKALYIGTIYYLLLLIFIMIWQLGCPDVLGTA
jgi:hypothetical protein